MSRKLKAVIVASLVALALTACSAPRVQLNYYAQDDAMRPTCIELVSTLPGHVLDQGKRTLEPIEEGSESSDLTKTATVWGDPVISLLCGVLELDTINLSLELIEVNGISWYAEKTTNGYRFTSKNLVVRVQVRVPKDYAPETNVLADLSDALTKYIVAS